MEVIRPSSDLRNHYNEISTQCRESKSAVIITVNGRGGDTVVLGGLQQYNQMKSELELLRTLAEAEDDVKNGRLAPVQDSFDQLRASLLDRKKVRCIEF